MEDISASSEDDKETPAGDEDEPHVVDSDKTPPITSSDKLVELKSKSPVDFLKAILKTKSNLASRDGNSSTTSGSTINEPNARNLLHQIKARIFDIDLVAALRKDASLLFTLKNLLKKVDLLNISPKVSQVLISLSALLDQINAELLRGHATSHKLHTSIKEHGSFWEAANASRTKIENMENNYQALE